MNTVSEKLLNIIEQIKRTSPAHRYSSTKLLVTAAWPKLDHYQHLEAIRGIFADLWPEDYSVPKEYRFQMEAILGESTQFQQWFELSTAVQVDLYIEISHFQLNKKGEELESAVYMALSEHEAHPPGEGDTDEAIEDFNAWFENQDPKPGGYIK